jgi:WD40 repeat protein
MLIELLNEDLEKFEKIKQWDKDRVAYFENMKKQIKEHPTSTSAQHFGQTAQIFMEPPNELLAHYPAYQLSKTYHQGNLDLTNKEHQEGLSNFLRFSKTKELKNCTQSKHALHIVNSIEREIARKNNNKDALAKLGDGLALGGGLYNPYTTLAATAWGAGRLLLGDNYLDRPPTQLYHQTLDLIKQSSPLDRITELSSLCSSRSMSLPAEVQLRCADEFRRTQNTLGKQLKNAAKPRFASPTSTTSTTPNDLGPFSHIQEAYLKATGASANVASPVETIGGMLKNITNKDLLKACDTTLDAVRIRLSKDQPVSSNEINLSVFKNIVDELRTTASKTSKVPAVCREPATLELISHLANQSSAQQRTCSYLGDLAEDAGIQNPLIKTIGDLGGHLGDAATVANDFIDLMQSKSSDASAIGPQLQQLQQTLGQAQQTMRSVKDVVPKDEHRKPGKTHEHIEVLANLVFTQTTTIATQGFEAQAHIAQLQGELQVLKKKDPNNKVAILKKSVALQNTVNQAKARHDKTQQLLGNIGMGADLVAGLVAFVEPKVAQGLSIIANAGITIASSIVSIVATGLAFGPIGAIAGAVVSFFGWLFSSDSDPIEVVVDYIRKLSQQIQAFQEHVDKRFDRMEDILLQLDSRTQRRFDHLEQRFDRLENMLSDMYRGIIRAFGETQGKLDQLKVTANKTLTKVKQLLGTLEQSLINDRLNKLRNERSIALNYHQENPYSVDGQHMGLDMQHRYYGTFRTWSTQVSRESIFLGEYKKDMTLEDITARINTHGVENNIQLLADYAAKHHQLKTIDAINPVVWSEGALSLLAFVQRTPEFEMQASQSKGIQEIIQLGKTLRSFFWQLKSSDVLFVGLFKAYRKTVEDLIELVFDEMKSAKQSEGYLGVKAETTVDELKVNMEDRISNTTVSSVPCIASGSEDKTARIWNAQTGQPLLTLSGHTGVVRSVAYSPDNQRLATGSDDKTVWIWNAQTGQHLLTLSGHTGILRSVAYSPDSQRLASGSDDNTARVWNAQTGQHLQTFSGHTDVVRSVTYSSDNQRLVTGSGDKTARIWNAQTGQHLLTLSGHTADIYSVAYSPDNERLATGSADKTARVWNAQTGQHLLTVSGHTSAVQSVIYSPDKQCLLTGSYDNTARVWNAQTGQHLLTLSGHTHYVYSVTYSPDSQRLVTGSLDKTARIWNAQGQHLGTLSGHTNYVLSVAYPNGKGEVLMYNDKSDTGSHKWKLSLKETTAKQITRLKENQQSPDILTQFLSVYVNNDYRNELQAQLHTSKKFQKQLNLLDTHRQLLFAYLKLTFPMRYNHDIEFRAAITEQLWGIEKINVLLSETLKDPDQYSVIRIKRDLLKSIDQFEQRVLTHVIQAQQCTARESEPCHPLVDYTLKILTAYLALLQHKKLQQKEKPQKQKSKTAIDVNAFSNKVVLAAASALAGQDFVNAMSIYNKGLSDLSVMKETASISDEDLAPLMKSFTAGMAVCLKAITKSVQQSSAKPSQVPETVFNKSSANDNTSSSENANNHFV